LASEPAVIDAVLDLLLHCIAVSSNYWTAASSAKYSFSSHYALGRVCTKQLLTSAVLGSGNHQILATKEKAAAGSSQQEIFMGLSEMSRHSVD